jgi:uncharacterized protein YbgA (DUF1722 family)
MFMPNDKQTLEHLKDLKDEVRDLHPVLNVLFRKLPGIERVHYNQGSNEMGADFILYRSDPALLRTTCIGVVVKADSIRQNTAEVERQIKECFVPRKAPDGSEVQIREVWVVSNHEVTRNARDMLSHLYSDRKIEFISGQDLATLVDRFAPDAFTTTSPALQDFAEASLAALEADDRRSLVVPGMDNFYVEPRVLRKDFDAYGNAKSSRAVQSFDDLLRTATRSQLSIVQAGAGGGKSRLARELSKQILRSSNFADGSLIPAIVHAKDFAIESRARIEDLAASLRDKVKAGSATQVLLFLDGFDEVDMSDADRARLITEWMSAASSSNVSLVVMSRLFDEVTVLGGRVHSVDVFTIEPLKGTRALDFLKKVAGQFEGRSKIVSDLNDSLLLRALEGNPIAYILLGRLIADNQQDLPSNLTELFQKYTELVLGRWEISKGLRSQQEYEVIVESLIWLSQYSLDNQLPEIARCELAQWIHNYCRDRNLLIVADELVDRACARNSILYFRSDTGGVGFRHRAFCEFFYARGLNRKGAIELKPEVFSPYWINSYYFLAGIQRDCPDLIQSLVDLPLEKDFERIMRVLNLGNVLLAGYMTPVQYAKDALSKVAQEASSLFLDACDPKSGSPLTALPTLQVLGVLAMTFRGQYGYKHFQVALEEAVFEVEAQGNTDKAAIALFLLDTAYKEAGGELRFDQLIEKFGDSLPLPVKLGIGHEAERMKVVSDRVKKMERNVKRSFRGRLDSKEYLRKLYRVPVRKLEKPL